ncbi:uncharacterized protein LOC130712344 [Lotus japonicus]|uniref:uncharacterized protein LOC130712344 n=1 Tax=Lotus japonicus TaxID=34305 RepID=UPI00258B6A1D|nr:uncharacterized protein LOC130712344 [Lotus japonicus]
MTPYEALYGPRCRTPLCWHQDGENLVIGPELVQQTTEEVKRIQEKMRISQSHQKSYADNRRKELEFQTGYHVFLRLRKYMADDSHVLEPDDIQLKDYLTMVMPPIKIINRSTKRLRNKEVSLVKVVWN